jgi:hypothetical protein
MPEWTRGGRELLFETLDGRLMAVGIETTSGFRAGIPAELFHLPMGSPGVGATSWAVSADGERLYVLVPPRNTAVAKLEVLTDFARLVGHK